MGRAVETHRARPEAADPATRVSGREHDPPAEAVDQVVRAALPALGEPRGEQLVVAVAGLGETRTSRSQAPRRVADPELAQGLLAEAAPEQVVAGAGRLPRLPQVARVVGRGARQERIQTLVAGAPGGGGRILLFALQPHAETVRQRLERAFEIEPLGLHHEVERRPRLRAAEAVIELLVRAHVERRRALVVERAATEVAVLPGAPQLDLRLDERHHVDRVPYAIDRVGGVPAHGANATGTVSASNWARQKRSVIPATWSVTRRPRSRVGDRSGNLGRVGCRSVRTAYGSRDRFSRAPGSPRPEVHPLEHERPQRGHRAADLIALDDLAGGGRVLDEVVDQRVDPPRTCVARGSRSRRRAGPRGRSPRPGRHRRCRG